ncbi:unnamed protein product, partial [Rotaria magnacalcarata]
GLDQNTNLISTLSHLLSSSTLITIVLSWLRFLSNANALNNNCLQIPVALQEILQHLFSGI